MRIFRSLLAGCLLLLLNSAVVAYAQDDKNEAAKPAQQDEAKPGTANSQEPMPAQEEKRTQEERNKQGKDREKPAREQKSQQNNDETRNARNAQGKEQNEQKEQNRASVSGGEHNRNRTSQRIPDEKFRASFGQAHHFHVAQPVIVEGRPRFQYSGYWFEFVDAWPGDWSYSDDCYVDYIDGEYFLIDVLHPGVRLALVVVAF